MIYLGVACLLLGMSNARNRPFFNISGYEDVEWNSGLGCVEFSYEVEELFSFADSLISSTKCAERNCLSNRDKKKEIDFVCYARFLMICNSTNARTMMIKTNRLAIAGTKYVSTIVAGSGVGAGVVEGASFTPAYVVANELP